MKCITILVVSFLLILDNFFLKKTFISKYITNFLLLIIIILLVLSTKNGKKLTTLIKNATIEVKKIVQPTKREAFYTTIIIVLVSFLTSIIVWGLDNILFYIISIITKLRI